VTDEKRAFKDANGQWFANYGIGDEQWHLKIRRGPRDWEHRRVPPQVQSDADAKKYVRRYIKRRRANGAAKAGPAQRHAGVIYKGMTFEEWGTGWRLARNLAAFALMYSNCSFRSGCDAPSRFLRTDCRL